MPRRPKDILLPALLFVGNLALLGPYLVAEFSLRGWSAEYTSIGLARLFQQQHFTWNPLWYGGIPFHYSGPPLLPGSVALLAWLVPGLSVARAYHLVSGLAYALAPVTLYFLARYLLGSRLWAAVAALAYSVLPSAIYLLPDPAGLAGRYGRAPWPFVTLLEYGEAGHLAVAALLPLVLLAAWRALEDFRFFHYSVASFAAALLPLTSQSGTVALTMGLGAVLVAQGRIVGLGRTPDYRTAIKRTLAIWVTAHTLGAFWLTAGSFATRASLAYVEHLAERVLLSEMSLFAVGAVAAAGVLLSLAMWSRTPPVVAFLLAWIALAGASGLAFSQAGSDFFSEPWRSGVEFHMALALALGLVLSLLPKPRRLTVLAAPIIIATLGATLGASHLFLRTAWSHQFAADPHATLFYQITDWLARQPPGRVFVSGEPAGTLNVFADIPQVGGGSPQGAVNPLILAAQREAALGSCDSPQKARRLAQLWPRALGCRRVLVHSAASQEYYHHYVFPERFAGLPQLLNNGRGDKIYAVPGAGPTAVVVSLGALRRLPALRSTDDRRALAAYVAWAEGKRRARFQWLRYDRARVSENLGRGEAILVKTNYDSGWHARGGQFRLTADPIGFLLLEPLRSGGQTFDLHYRGSWDLWLGRGLAAVTALVLLLGGVSPLRFALGLAVVWLASFGVWTWKESRHGLGNRIAVAREAFGRLQPPLISPGGIVDAESYQPPPLAPARPVAIFGRNLGAPQDRLRILVDGREAGVLDRSSRRVRIELPPMAGARRVEIAPEVNGCRGNSFMVDVRGGAASQGR